MAFSDPACGNFPKERRQSGNEATFHQHQRSCSVSRRQLFNHLFKLVCCILTDDFSLKAPVLVPSALTFPLTGALHYCQRCRSNVWFKGSFLQPGMKNQSSFLLSPVLIFQVSCLALTRCCFPEPPPKQEMAADCPGFPDLWVFRRFDPLRDLFLEHLWQTQFVSRPGEPAERAGVLLIELMEVFLEQGEFREWKQGILCALCWNSQSVMRQNPAPSARRGFKRGNAPREPHFHQHFQEL